MKFVSTFAFTVRYFVYFCTLFYVVFIYFSVFLGDLEVALFSVLFSVLPVVNDPVVAVVAVVAVFLPAYPTLTVSFVDVPKPIHF